MSNAKRPALARKHTTTTETNREKALAQGYRLTIEGETYQAQLGDVTPAIARELRRATGKGFLGLLREMSTDPDVDLISAAVWVARRTAGEMVAFEEVEVGYHALLGDDFDVAVAESPEAEAPDPEA